MAQYNIGDTVVALYDFPKQEQEDLNVWNGDTLRVINNNVGEGWLLLENIYTNEQGLVPEGYVQFQREAKFVGGGASGGLESGRPFILVEKKQSAISAALKVLLWFVLIYFLMCFDRGNIITFV